MPQFVALAIIAPYKFGAKQLHQLKATGRYLKRGASATALALALAGIFGAAADPASAQAVVTSEGRLGRVSVALGHSQTVRLPAAYSEVLVGAAEIADVLPVSEMSVYLLGKQIGTTNVAVFDANKKLIGVLDVEVTPDLGYIQSRIRSATSSASGVRVSSAGGRIVLNGSVPDASTAERVVTIASGFSKGEVVNALQVASPQQVLLEVRIIEATRNAARELGVSWDGRGYGQSGYRFLTGGGTGGASTPFGVLFTNILRTNNINVDVVIEALEQKGLVRKLANPNLTAMSGSTANFLVGGEFPVPTSSTPATGGALVPTVTVTFKRFGVLLDFTPTVLEGGVIHLRISPEVSDVDYTTAPIQTGQFVIPGVTVRKATTEIALKSGQSFAIAGLLQQQNRTDTAQLPWIGSIPILGALFRSQAYQKNETELVIMVTPHLARPAPPGQTLASPLDKSLPANDFDFFAMGKFELKKDYRHYVETGVGIVGPYGHVLDVTRNGQPVALRVRN